MRRLWRIVVAAALLVLVASGTWACLNASVDPATASTSTVVAIAAAAVMVAGILAQGQGDAAIGKVRQVVGALGLFLTPIAAVLTLLALVDPPMVPRFFLLTVVALLAWMQGVAAQSGLSLPVLLAWAVTLLVFAAGVLGVGGVIAFASVSVSDAVGLDGEQGIRIAFGLVLGLTAAVLLAWARGRRDRQAVGRAIVRAAFGRTTSGDVVLLGAGPGPILRRRPMTETELAEHVAGQADRDARLATIDAALVDPSPRDHEAAASDR